MRVALNGAGVCNKIINIMYKTLKSLLFIILPLCGQSQDRNTPVDFHHSVDSFSKIDTRYLVSINPYLFGDSTLCIERGHIPGHTYSTTLMHCPPYIVDTDSTTIKVIPCCNASHSNCARCGATFFHPCEERRIVLWRRE